MYVLPCLFPSGRVLRLILAGCCLGCLTGPVLAQAPPTQPEAALPNPLASEAPSLRFEHLGLEDGLAQGSANTIMQDRHGFGWIGTQDGLNRHDGYTFTVYRHDPFDAMTLSSSHVTALFEHDVEGGGC